MGLDGMAINELAGDTAVRKMLAGSRMTIMLDRGPTELLPTNRVFLGRSLDEGKTLGSRDIASRRLNVSGGPTNKENFQS